MVCVVAVPATSTVANTSENCRCFIFVFFFFKKENCSISQRLYVLVHHIIALSGQKTNWQIFSIIVGDDDIQQCRSESDSNAAAAAAFSRDIFRRITTVVQDFFLATDWS